MAKQKQSAAQRIVIPAGRGIAQFVKKGRKLKIINTYGTQVVDCWAFNANNPAEFMSMEHCRVALDTVRPRVGDTLVTNERRDILKIVDDTCGAHDTLLAACDRARYQQLGCTEYHRNCEDNLWEAMGGYGLRPTETPSPFNLWQNTPVEENGTMGQYPSAAKKGDFIIMRAQMDLVLCLSACPQDITKINSRKPRNAHLELW